MFVYRHPVVSITMSTATPLAMRQGSLERAGGSGAYPEKSGSDQRDTPAETGRDMGGAGGWWRQCSTLSRVRLCIHRCRYTRIHRCRYPGCMGVKSVCISCWCMGVKSVCKVRLNFVTLVSLVSLVAAYASRLDSCSNVDPPS